MTTTAAAPARQRARLIDPTLYRIEIIRQLRNPYTLVFTIAMPLGLYLLFGAFMGWGDERMPHGDVAFWTMVSMAAFGTATAMSSLCSIAASEVRQGWGRQIAMTPLPVVGYVLTKVSAAMTFALIAIVAVFTAGLLTGVEADDPWRWAASAGIVLLVGAIFGLWGLGVGLLFNPDSAAALASISITVFGFLGNVFVPLQGVMLTVATFTPMYGYVGLARWPVSEGTLVNGGQDPLWALLLNVIVWTLLMIALACAGVVRSRRRA